MFAADNLNYEQTDGLKTVYKGASSAVAALTPFITPGTGKSAYSLSKAWAAPSVTLPTTGELP